MLPVLISNQENGDLWRNDKQLPAKRGERGLLLPAPLKGQMTLRRLLWHAPRPKPPRQPTPACLQRWPWAPRARQTSSPAPYPRYVVSGYS
eukprot:6212640-Pleurochrysis_carterae.AAC.3